MLRHLHASEFALVGACLAFACSSAPPVEVGVDYITPRLSESEAPPEPEVPPLDDDAVPGEEVNEASIPNFDGLIDDPDFERGEVSPFCHRSFQACGGLLAGTWVVEDNCNPVITTGAVLQSWGERMDLDESACWGAVKRLRWNWSGELRFEGGVAIDNRERKQRVDMELDSRCLNASYGVPQTESVAPQVCDAFQNESTTCGLLNGVCLCSNRTVSTGAASGVYGVLGLSVAIAANPTTRYEYCVDGDTLLWREKEGDLRHVVLRRSVTPPPGTTDPVELPR